MKKSILTSLLIVVIISASFVSKAKSKDEQTTEIKTELSEKEKLVVVWTSGDREVALKMVFMYTYNAKKYEWWEDITLLIWGPSAKLLTEDKELQEYVAKMKEEGVNLLACKGCADQYGIEEELTKLGVTVKYTGTDLTNFIKQRHVVTF